MIDCAELEALLEAGALAGACAQEVETCAAHFAVTLDHYFVDAR